MKIATRFAASLILLAGAPIVFACTQPVSVCAKPAKTSFPLIQTGQPAQVLVESSANSAVAASKRTPGLSFKM